MTRSALAIAIATLLVGSMASEPMALAQQPLAQPTTEQVSYHEGVGTASGDSQTDQRATTNRADQKFLKEFAQMNAAAVEKAKSAEFKGDDAEVKEFATHMIETHSQTIGKVITLAVMASVDVKAKPDFAQKAKAAFLDINVGGSFDRAYMKEMVKEDEKAIEMLQEEINDGQDVRVRQFASEALSDAQMHLQIAQDLRARVYAYESAKRSLARNDSNGAEKVAANR